MRGAGATSASCTRVPGNSKQGGSRTACSRLVPATPVGADRDRCQGPRQQGHLGRGHPRRRPSQTRSGPRLPSSPSRGRGGPSPWHVGGVSGVMGSAVQSQQTLAQAGAGGWGPGRRLDPHRPPNTVPHSRPGSSPWLSPAPGAASPHACAPPRRPRAVPGRQAHSCVVSPVGRQVPPFWQGEGLQGT